MKLPLYQIASTVTYGMLSAEGLLIKRAFSNSNATTPSNNFWDSSKTSNEEFSLQHMDLSEEAHQIDPRSHRDGTLTPPPTLAGNESLLEPRFPRNARSRDGAQPKAKRPKHSGSEEYEQWGRTTIEDVRVPKNTVLVGGGLMFGLGSGSDATMDDDEEFERQRLYELFDLGPRKRSRDGSIKKTKEQILQRKAEIVELKKHLPKFGDYVADYKLFDWLVKQLVGKPYYSHEKKESDMMFTVKKKTGDQSYYEADVVARYDANGDFKKDQDIELTATIKYECVNDFRMTSESVDEDASVEYFKEWRNSPLITNPDWEEWTRHILVSDVPTTWQLDLHQSDLNTMSWREMRIHEDGEVDIDEKISMIWKRENSVWTQRLPQSVLTVKEKRQKVKRQSERQKVEETYRRRSQELEAQSRNATVVG